MRRHRTPADQPAENETVDLGVESEDGAQELGAEGGDQAGRIGAELKALTEKVQSLNDDNAQLKDQVMRTMADLQNFRKRAEQERVALRQYAAEQIMVELLPILDNLERTLAAGANGAGLEAILDGVRATERHMRAVLESKSLTRIEATGTPFDPDLHHALATHETEDVEEGTVTHEIEAGYKLADKVIRPAKVRVAKKP